MYSWKVEKIHEIEELIRSQGAGAAVKWEAIAKAAMFTDDEESKKACEGLVGQKLDDIRYFAAIHSAASYAMTDGEAMALSSRARAEIKATLLPQDAQKRNVERAKKYLSNRLKALREDRGLTQREVARVAKIPDITYRKLENGDVNLLHARVDTMLKIASALCVEIEELYRPDENQGD